MTREELELLKALRKLHRMTNKKVFRKPDEKDRAYKAPTKVFRTNGVVDCCRICNRPTSFGSRRCRECYQKMVRDRYEQKITNEAERVRIATEALNLIERNHNG